MSETDVLEMLDRVGAVITGSHVVFTSGRHGSAYINKDAIYPHASVVSDLCRTIAEHFARCNVEVVASPAVAGVALVQHTSLHFTDLTKDWVPGVYAEKAEDGAFAFKRGYDKYISGKRVLVVEDVLTTGGSAKAVIEEVRRLGGVVIALAVLCNRGGVKREDVGDVPELFALCNIQLDSWAEEECPLCQEGVPINTEVGKGKDYLARKRK